MTPEHGHLLEIHALLDRLEAEAVALEHGLQEKIKQECSDIRSHLARGEEKLVEMTESLERMQTALEEVTMDTAPLQDIIERIGALI